MVSRINLRNFYPFVSNNYVFLKNQGWVRSIFWDVFWLQSGLWLTLLLIISNSSFFHDFFYITGVFIFWIGHRFSSFYLAWGTKTYRPLCINQRIRFLFFPAVLVFGVFFVIFFVPKNVLPFSITERLLGLFLLDFAWGAHHFAAQHYGILRLYDRISISEFSELKKNKDRIFCWGVGGFMVIVAEILHGASFLQEKNFFPILRSGWIFEEIHFLLQVGTFAVFGFTVYMVINAWRYQSGLPKILYLLGLGMMVMSAFYLDPFQFLMLWTLQHWMVSLGLASHMGGNDNQKNKSFVTSDYSFINFFKRYLVLFYLCTFSFLATPFFEIEAVSIDRIYSENLMPDLIEFLRKSDFATFFLGLGLSTGFLHYWMDRSVFRFSDQETCKSANKLLFPYEFSLKK